MGGKQPPTVPTAPPSESTEITVVNATPPVVHSSSSESSEIEMQDSVKSSSSGPRTMPMSKRRARDEASDAASLDVKKEKLETADLVVMNAAQDGWVYFFDKDGKVKRRSADVKKEKLMDLAAAADKKFAERFSFPDEEVPDEEIQATMDEFEESIEKSKKEARKVAQKKERMHKKESAGAVTLTSTEYLEYKRLAKEEKEKATKSTLSLDSLSDSYLRGMMQTLRMPFSNIGRAEMLSTLKQYNATNRTAVHDAFAIVNYHAKAKQRAASLAKGQALDESSSEEEEEHPKVMECLTKEEKEEKEKDLEENMYSLPDAYLRAIIYAMRMRTTDPLVVSYWDLSRAELISTLKQYSATHLPVVHDAYSAVNHHAIAKKRGASLPKEDPKEMERLREAELQNKTQQMLDYQQSAEGKKQDQELFNLMKEAGLLDHRVNDPYLTPVGQAPGTTYYQLNRDGWYGSRPESMFRPGPPMEQMEAERRAREELYRLQQARFGQGPPSGSSSGSLFGQGPPRGSLFEQGPVTNFFGEGPPVGGSLFGQGPVATSMFGGPLGGGSAKPAPPPVDLLALRKEIVDAMKQGMEETVTKSVQAALAQAAAKALAGKTPVAAPPPASAPAAAAAIAAGLPRSTPTDDIDLKRTAGGVTFNVQTNEIVENITLPDGSRIFMLIKIRSNKLPGNLMPQVYTVPGCTDEDVDVYPGMRGGVCSHVVHIRKKQAK